MPCLCLQKKSYFSFFVHLYFLVQNLLAQCICLDHHSRNVERPLEEIALCRLCHGSVSVKIAIPLAELGIWEVGVGPLADALVLVDVLVVARSQVSVERSNDGFGLWSPELHIL